MNIKRCAIERSRTWPRVFFFILILNACNEAGFVERSVDSRAPSLDAQAEARPVQSEASPEVLEAETVASTAGLPAPEPAPVITEETRFVEEIAARAGQNVTIETFLFPGIYHVNKSIENLDEVLKLETVEQATPGLKYFTATVAGQSNHQSTIQKTAPRQIEDDHHNTWVGKPLDLFVTVDDSESFSNEAIGRAKRAVEHLLSEVYDADWQLFIGGLESVSNSFDRFRIQKPATLAEAKAMVTERMDQIFAEGSLGDERVFRSLHKLQYHYRGQDRDSATHAYLVISDAPNCKDRSNNESGSCDRRPGNDDHHQFIFDRNSYLPTEMQHMSLFGAYYRMSADTGICGNADQLEVPDSKESLKLQSQYAELAFRFEKRIYNVPESASPSWVGDLCQTTESLDWLTTFARAIKNVQAKRFRTSAADEIFSAPDQALNFVLESSISGGSLPTTAYSRPHQRIVVLDDAVLDNVTAVYHQANQFRRLHYGNLLLPLPEAGTVQMAWGVESRVCVEAVSFAGLPDTVKCRHAGADLYLRDVDFLPSLTPNASPLNLLVTWKSKVVEVQSLTFAASSAIFPDTVAVSAYPDSAAAIVAAMQATYEANGKRLRLSFSEPLPVGTYKVSYSELDQTITTVKLATDAVDLPTGLLCYLPDSAFVPIEVAPGVLAVVPPTVAYPCNFDVSKNEVTFSGRVPVDVQNQKRLLSIAYLGYVAPLNDLPLDYPVFDQEVVVRRQSLAKPGEFVRLEEGVDFEIKANILTLAADLNPGEGLSVAYDFTQPLSDCFLLSNRALDDHDYHFWYGPPGLEQRLAADVLDLEEIDIAEAKTAIQVCLSVELLAYEHRLVVGYVSEEASFLPR